MKNPTVVLKTRKFDCLKKNLLPSAIGIDHFLDTRTVKIQARNCCCNVFAIVK